MYQHDKRFQSSYYEPRQFFGVEPAFVESDTFESFFMGGFECSTHRRKDFTRLDMLASTGHDQTASADYRQLGRVGLKTVRDGLRWHLIEKTPGHYDWSSFLDMLKAANEAGVQVIWDLLHYGWPDELNIFDRSFVERFEKFALAVARLVRDESDAVPFYCPVNEISYFAWAGGEEQLINPFCTGKSDLLKQQLVRASIAAIEAVKSVDPRARIVHSEPSIHIVDEDAQGLPGPHFLADIQYQAMDMITGRLEPGLGGKPSYLDLLGLNYYPQNQWFLKRGIIPVGHHSYKPFRELIQEAYLRYNRPVLIAETGAEGTARPAWLYYVAREVLAAKTAGSKVEGLCLYPVTDYPGWENGRLCPTGLLGAPDLSGLRQFYRPLVEELIASAALFRSAASTRAENQPGQSFAQMIVHR